jgi:hypothetical protein
MKHIIRKAYWNYEKEENWINEMSTKGLALTDYSWCRYVFEETSNGEYTYRIELLENWPTHPESLQYIKFLEENGVECVATYMRWIYLRKKSNEGEFDIYSDIESKIKHYKKISAFWITFIWLEFLAGFMNIFIGIFNYSMNGNTVSHNMSYVNVVLGSIVFGLGIIMFKKLHSPIRKKIKELEQEKDIRE